LKTIIKTVPCSNGAHANQSGDVLATPDGWAEIPENLLSAWEQYKPFVILTVESGTITDLQDNATARAESTAIPIETLRAQKLAELTAATEQAIFAGIDVTTSFGTLRYPLTDRDQSDLALFKLLIAGGGAGWLYNATGQDHEFYPAEDLTLIINAGLQFVTHNRTYFSELRKWVERETDLSGIVFGAALPEDLASDFAAKLTLLSGGG